MVYLERTTTKLYAIELQRAAHAALFSEFDEGEPCRLALTASHAHIFYFAHLTEELEQLFSSG